MHLKILALIVSLQGIMRGCVGKKPEYFLLKGLDPNKSKSYFLYTLGQKPLSRTLFPIGHLHKPKSARLPKKRFLKIAGKRQHSICFIASVNSASFYSVICLAAR